MATIVMMREIMDIPFHVSSAYRCELHDDEIGGSGVHPTGRAIDIAIRGTNAYRLVGQAVMRGITGIGIKQKGNKRFIHLDNLGPEDKSSRPWIWSY